MLNIISQSYNVCDSEEVRLSGEEVVDVWRVEVEGMTAQLSNNSLRFFSCR